ncbi:MAG: hypothetical protein NC206_07285 [Bacteroides sp.]|nr:hypothetical protein [Roseburia sp.]MCM1346874.1 hypothetical protein [Bacteroides sp.]MCM1421417.1 hypothetical protein [Bacteroides sp.]
MKKLLLSVVVAMASTLGMNAQNWFSTDVCNHLSVGITAGTPGIGVDVATTLGSHFQVRGGVTVMPGFSFSTKILADKEYVSNWNGEYSYTSVEDVNVEGKTGFTNGKLLIDFYPARTKTFHLTVGAYFGSSKIFDIYNKDEGALTDFKGLHIGDYMLMPDENGNIDAQIKTSSFKPYVGIGFGRSVAKRKDLSFQCDMGVQFWGKPKLYCNGEQIESSSFDDDGDFLDIMSNIRVYPVISFRLSGKIF